MAGVCGQQASLRNPGKAAAVALPGAALPQVPAQSNPPITANSDIGAGPGASGAITCLNGNVRTVQLALKYRF